MKVVQNCCYIQVFNFSNGKWDKKKNSKNYLTKCFFLMKMGEKVTFMSGCCPRGTGTGLLQSGQTGT